MASYDQAIRCLGTDNYIIEWTTDYRLDGSRLRFPRVTRKGTDEKGAKRFCKKWGLTIPEPFKSKYVADWGLTRQDGMCHNGTSIANHCPETFAMTDQTAPKSFNDIKHDQFMLRYERQAKKDALQRQLDIAEREEAEAIAGQSRLERSPQLDANGTPYDLLAGRLSAVGTTLERVKVALVENGPNIKDYPNLHGHKNYCDAITENNRRIMVINKLMDEVSFDLAILHQQKIINDLTK